MIPHHALPPRAICGFLSCCPPMIYPNKRWLMRSCRCAVMLTKEPPSIWLRRKREHLCVLSRSGSFKMSADFLPLYLSLSLSLQAGDDREGKKKKKKNTRGFFFIFCFWKQRGRWRQTEGEAGGEKENDNEVSARGDDGKWWQKVYLYVCVCVCVCVEISMSTANSPGLFTRLWEGSDTLARSLSLSLSSTRPADE